MDQNCLISLLLSLETKEKFGYTFDSLSRGSHKKIIHKCNVCGISKENECINFWKGKYLAHRKCAKAKREETCLKRYGVQNPSQAKDVKERKKQTTLQHYGVEFPLQSSVIQNQIKETCSKKYGVECIAHIPGLQEKREQTNLEIYGTKYPQILPEIRAKTKETWLQNYGVEHPWYSPEIRNKIKQTNLQRYGFEHHWRLREILQKREATWIEKYGLEHPLMRPEYRFKLQEWLYEHPESRFVSKPELEILGWIQQYCPEASKNNDFFYEADIFISTKKVGIEYNGLYWHQESNVGKNYHLNKTKYFKEKNVRLIHIFEHEWRDRQEQVKSFLLSAIGKNEYRIGARKCTLLWSSLPEDIKEVHNFLENYHIQGQPNNTKHVVRVLYNNELLAVATFGKHHRNNKDWVLTRFCTKTNYTIQGVLSRVSKLASQQLKEDILSWADYRLSQGNGYEKAGWVFEELLPPDYFYHRHGKVVSKQSRQKQIVNTPLDMTEKEHAKVEGFYQVYDCGKIRYRYRYSIDINA